MMKKHGFRNAENVKLIGHPKFDYVYETINKGVFLHSDWEKKIKGRPVILWNSHFGVEPGAGVGTYFQIKDFIFPYFKKNKDMVLLWRPHPLFWNSVIQQPNVDKSAFKKMVNELIQQDNVIVDKTADYRYAFCMADALISDAATFLAEFNATGKPVMYTPKIDGEGVCDNRFIENLYIGNSEDDINLFFDNVREGKDPKKEDRLSSFEREFGNFDGNIGKRVKEYLISELTVEKKQQAHNFVQNSFQELL
jgi:CDP-glycerol glycerophosphotransferase (TagB/SpsB family)